MIGTVDGELPFEGLYVNDVAALNVTAFRAAMTVDFRKVSRIEIVSVDSGTQVVTVSITFVDSYSMPATFNLAENTPWIAIGSYGRANYSADSLLSAIARVAPCTMILAIIGSYQGLIESPARIPVSARANCAKARWVRVPVAGRKPAATSSA